MLLPLVRTAYIALLIGMAVIGIGFFVESNDTASMILVLLAIIGVGGLVLFTSRLTPLGARRLSANLTRSSSEASGIRRNNFSR